jgi:alginate O-acetyltransferase complex protein AlgI
VLVGLFKKVVIADNMAPIANLVFTRLGDGDSHVGGLEALLGLYAFAFQIYGDFSGYSAIARGISRWLGFELVQNFDLPYLATTPAELWRRWHISLSTWLRDYLYIPLGGNRHRRSRNLLVTMALGGLWHGASLTFVGWGLYHGLLLVLFRLLGVKEVGPAAGLRWVVRVVLMFHLTCLGWLLFRADSFAEVGRMGAALARWAPSPLAPAMIAELLLLALLPSLLDLWLRGEKRLDRLWRAPWPVQALGYGYVLAMITFLHAGAAHAFIYFQF